MINGKRMKRKVKLVLAFSALVLSVAGCGNAVPEMTEEERREISEYAAVLLLKHDANSRSRLVDVTVIEEEERKQAAWEEAGKTEMTELPEDEGMRPVEDTPIIEEDKEVNNSSNSLEEYFSLQQGVNIDYVGYRLCESYPENGEEDYFTLEASEGKKLLVFDFQIQNNGGEALDVDLFAKGASYRVIINEKHSYNMMTTMLMNDLSTYVAQIQAGGSDNLVLITEIDQSTADGLNAMNIYLKNESKQYNIRAK